MACPSRCSFCNALADHILGWRPQDEHPICNDCVERTCPRCLTTNVELVGPDSVCPQCDYDLRLHEALQRNQERLLAQIQQLKRGQEG